MKTTYFLLCVSIMMSHVGCSSSISSVENGTGNPPEASSSANGTGGGGGGVEHGEGGCGGAGGSIPTDPQDAGTCLFCGDVLEMKGGQWESLCPMPHINKFKALHACICSSKCESCGSFCEGALPMDGDPACLECACTQCGEAFNECLSDQ